MNPRIVTAYVALIAFSAAVPAGCHGGAVDPTKALGHVVAPQPAAITTPKSGPVGPRFREVGVDAGLNYRWHIEGKRPLSILQTIGNGCAFLDYNGDGNLDILLVGPRLALYSGDGHGHFTDVSKETGLSALQGHFLGCAVGDYDNDGFPDIYISGWRTGVLLHNESGKRFIDVTKQMGLQPQPFGTSCGFADLDGDGYLDLYVANYVSFDPTKDLVTCPEHGIMTGCGPNDYDAAQGVIYHNESGRRFRDVTASWKIRQTGKGLGVAFADFDRSGVSGMAVANDLMANDLFKNRLPGRLENVGVSSGMAFDDEGQKHAGMGVDWGDYDNDGNLDLFVTTFGDEMKCLYRNAGPDSFKVVSTQTGLDKPTRPYVGWGCKFFDADNDGWLDLIIANGHVQDNIAKFEKAAFHQPTVFMHNRGGRHLRFEDAGKASGIAALPPILGRGLAIGDYDNDGRIDVLVVDSEGPPLLLHNESTTVLDGWVGFKLVGAHGSNRDAYGSVVTVRSHTMKWTRQCQPAGSYLSSSDPRVHFGLGNEKLESVTVRWPDGRAQTWMNLPTGRYYTIVEGQEPN